jgi:hypothetical protein
MKALEAENLMAAKCNLHYSKQPLPADAKTALKELFVLLENYGPVWYTQGHHDRAVAALILE